MKKATCSLIVKEGKILAVSRKDNPSDFGLPGGKVEGNENEISACKRETREETGLAINPSEIVHSEECDGRLCTTYLVDNYEGTIGSSEAGVIKWVNPEVIIEGSFSNYNKNVLQKCREKGIL